MDVYEILMKRRSVRQFKDEPIPGEVITRFMDVVNNAPSGGNIQPLSVILVQDREARKELARIIGGQPWVKNAPLSMIFCLDFHRIKRWAALMDTAFKGEKAMPHFLIAYADLMCAAQNVVVLAESLGLGSVYIGTIQNNPDEARAYFSMPDHVLPMMLLCLGYPKSVPRTIPKLDREVITHGERYRVVDDEALKRAFENKYGEMEPQAEKYLEKAFIEVLEADKQDDQNWTARVKEEMKRLEIRNNAQFLFKVRYPSEKMIQMNDGLFRSWKKAGFHFF
jgi:FMN reductase [NAD(P)H]